MGDLESVERRLEEIIKEDLGYAEKARLSYSALQGVANELKSIKSGRDFFERFNEVLLFPYNTHNNGYKEGIGYIRTEDGNISIFVGKEPETSIVHSFEEFFKNYNQKTSHPRERQDKIEFLNGINRDGIYKKFIELKLE